jgi:hypothetical protein
MTEKKTAPTPAATPAPAQAAKPAARNLFRATKEERRSALTHDQIADDLAEFERTGGTIEVLGNTPMLRTIPLSPTPAATGARKPAGKTTAAEAKPAE